MSEWSLSQLLSQLHNDIQRRLETVRTSFGHPDAKGDACENVWLELLSSYLPQRYQSETAHVVDSQGAFSQQIDIVIFDRQYSPLIFKYEGQTVIPAESVYAVFEAKQAINASHIRYAREKVGSVRRLHRTTLPIPHAGGTYKAKPPPPVLGGILTFDSDWTPALGDAMLDALGDGQSDDSLDLGCVAAHGHFSFQENNGRYGVHHGEKPATRFLFNLISQLQCRGTVPMIDIEAYAKWLANE